MRTRISTVALAAMTTFAIPSLLHAQEPAPAGSRSPSQLLAQREELKLTARQVSDLSLLTVQVRRYQRAELTAPSKPWIASSKGMTEGEAAKRALALLSPEQRELAIR